MNGNPDRIPFCKDDNGFHTNAREGGTERRSTYRLNTESQHLLHVHRPGNDEDVVHPYPSEGGESDRPGRPRRENGPPRNWHALRDSKENTIVTEIGSVKTISLRRKETSGAGECKRLPIKNSMLRMGMNGGTN